MVVVLFRGSFIDVWLPLLLYVYVTTGFVPLSFHLVSVRRLPLPSYVNHASDTFVSALSFT